MNTTYPEDNFRQHVLTAISAIPSGKVATYGQIARLVGSPRAARQVGGILSALPTESTLPWYRVINSQGKISVRGIHYQRQHDALCAEGIIFGANDSIDLKLYGWEPY